MATAVARPRQLFEADAYPVWIHDPGEPAPACRDVDPEVFFRPRGGDATEAKRICRRCPRLGACREWALSRPPYELYGVWGGLSRYDRRRIHRRAER